MSAAVRCRGNVRRLNPVFQFGTGEHLQLERALAEPPARERRGANDVGVEAFCRRRSVDTAGDEQPRDKTVIVQAVRRPIEAAVAGAPKRQISKPA